MRAGQTGGGRSASAPRAWGRCRVSGGGGVKAARSLRGASGRRLTLTQHPRPGPRAALWTCPQGLRLDLPPGLGLGVVWRPGANRHPPPRPVSPAPHLRPPCLCACSLCRLPAAIKRSKEKDELCTTPGCVMAGKPRPPPPAALPRGGAPETEGGARDGGRGEGRDAGRGSQDEALVVAQAGGRGALGLVDGPRPGLGLAAAGRSRFGPRFSLPLPPKPLLPAQAPVLTGPRGSRLRLHWKEGHANAHPRPRFLPGLSLKLLAD